MAVQGIHTLFSNGFFALTGLESYTKHFSSQRWQSHAIELDSLMGVHGADVMIANDDGKL